MLYIHEKFLVYNLETFKNCEGKNIMTTIIAIIYIIFLCDILSPFCQHWKGGETMAYGFLMNSEEIAIN